MDSRDSTDSGKQEDGRIVKKYEESDFTDLGDLVYAPLYALAKSNCRLQASVVEAIKSMGTLRQNGQDESIHLNNLNIIYEQVRQEGDEGYSVDDLQMQVPILSLVPVTSLNVEKARIDFSVEVKTDRDKEGQRRVMARICSPEQRESDHLPKVSYQMEITSLDATEGVMRLTDLLSANQVAKKLDTKPVAADGNLGSEKQKGAWQELSLLKAKLRKLKLLHHKISEMMAERERLQEISTAVFADGIQEFDKEKYLTKQSDLTKRIMECQEQILNKEIAFGLEHD